MSTTNAEIVRPDTEQTRRKDNHNSDRQVFVIRLRTAPNRDAIHELKALLKIALRRHGLRCLSVTEEVVERKGAA